MNELRFMLPDELKRKYPKMTQAQVRQLYDDNKDKLKEDLLKRFPTSKNPKGAKKRRRKDRKIERVFRAS